MKLRVYVEVDNKTYERIVDVDLDDFDLSTDEIDEELKLTAEDIKDQMVSWGWTRVE